MNVVKSFRRISKNFGEFRRPMNALSTVDGSKLKFVLYTHFLLSCQTMPYYVDWTLPYCIDLCVVFLLFTPFTWTKMAWDIDQCFIYIRLTNIIIDPRRIDNPTRKPTSLSRDSLKLKMYLNFSLGSGINIPA